MAESIPKETETCSISLTTNEKFTNSFILKIPNYFTLSEYEDASFDVKSPPFEFANATWCIRIQSRKKEITGEGTIKRFAVIIKRLNFEMPRQMIGYEITLLDENDAEYQHLVDNDVFDNNGNENLMIVAKNEEPLYDTRDTLTLIVNLFDFKLTEMGKDQVTLPTERGLEILSEDFKKVYQVGKNHDLTLRVADKEFRVHQDILMARSPVFEAMLSHDMTEKNEGFIDVPDSDPKAMEQFLLYVYSGKLEILIDDNIPGLYYLADKYNMIHLKEKCTDLLKKSLSVPVICDVIQLALNHSDTDLLEHATKYFLNHTTEILPTVGWVSFMSSNSLAANELFIKASQKWDSAKI